MKKELAFKLVSKILLRYKTKPRSVWALKGPYVPQVLIPMVTAAQNREANRIMHGRAKTRWARIGWVNVSQLRSTQKCLKHSSIRWNLAHFERNQKTVSSDDIDIAGASLPIITWSHGVAVIWNGNHRATAAAMLGKTRIMARIFRKRR